MFFISCLAITKAYDASALIVHFSNGDQLQGIVKSETPNAVTFISDSIGEISINRAVISSIEDPSIVTPKPEIEYKRELEAGYTLITGNTEKESYVIAGIFNRKTVDDEITFKGRTTEASSDKRMDEQKWDVLGRYAWNFGEEKKWFNSYRTTVDHDRFANIEYRVTPAVGIGYWVSDDADLKLMLENSLGYEYTNYNDETESEDNIVMIPHGYLEMPLFGKSVLSEDITAYPVLDDLGEYRLTSTTAFTNPLNEYLSLRLSWINEYNSYPADGSEKHDMTLVTSLVFNY
jgi:putative salt-induced outer membrane protein YdiY